MQAEPPMYTGDYDGVPGVIDFKRLARNYRPRELTELERIYVMFKRENGVNS
jgi:hypothetical protein